MHHSTHMAAHCLLLAAMLAMLRSSRLGLLPHCGERAQLRSRLRGCSCIRAQLQFAALAGKPVHSTDDLGLDVQSADASYLTRRPWCLIQAGQIAQIQCHDAVRCCRRVSRPTSPPS